MPAEPRSDAVRAGPVAPRLPTPAPRPVTVRIGRIEVVVPALPPAPPAAPPAPPPPAPAPASGDDLLARLWLDRSGCDR